MTINNVRKVGQFKARSDSGKIYFVIEYQTFHTILTGGNTKDEMAGLMTWKTSNGRSVNQIDAKTYQIASTDEVIRKF